MTFAFSKSEGTDFWRSQRLFKKGNIFEKLNCVVYEMGVHTIRRQNSTTFVVDRTLTISQVQKTQATYVLPVGAATTFQVFALLLSQLTVGKLMYVELAGRALCSGMMSNHKHTNR